MNCLCPYCNRVSEVPDIYRGKNVKCANCKNNFEAQLYIPQPIIVPSRILPAAGNLITKLWNKSPPVYRASFLATLGVISALALAYQFLPYWPKHRPISQMESISLKLESVKLFPIDKIPRKGIIRGRTLDYYEFRADATRNQSYLRVWVDEHDYPIAINATWIGTYFGDSAEILGNETEYKCSNSVIDGFRKLIGCDPFQIDYREANMTDGTKAWLHKEDKWLLDAIRSDASLGHLGNYKLSDHCKFSIKIDAEFHNLDPNKFHHNVYSYITVAKTW